VNQSGPRQDAHGLYRDSAGITRETKPEWILADQDGEVHGWYFNETDALAAEHGTVTSHRVIHDINGNAWEGATRRP
jgi:hypothetical protein